MAFWSWNLNWMNNAKELREIQLQRLKRKANPMSASRSRKNHGSEVRHQKNTENVALKEAEELLQVDR